MTSNAAQLSCWLWVVCPVCARWTKQLAARVASGQRLAVRMEGPYPDPYLAAPEAIDALAIMAGE